MTYNHESFIRDALHGFLIQRTTFPFRVVVHDDASTDRTTEIIKDFEVRYPAIIRGVYQTENLYSRGLRARPFVEPLLLGKYIALCEGDDYWLDERKLQIQVEFLEKNTDCVLTYHGFLNVDHESASVVGVGNGPRTVTRVYRNLPINMGSMEYAGKRVINGDRVSLFILKGIGKVQHISSIEPAVYRHHGKGIWSKRASIERAIEALRTRLYLELHLAHTKQEKAWLREDIAFRLKSLRAHPEYSNFNFADELGDPFEALWVRYSRYYPRRKLLLGRFKRVVRTAINRLKMADGSTRSEQN